MKHSNGVHSEETASPPVLKPSVNDLWAITEYLEDLTRQMPCDNPWVSNKVRLLLEGAIARLQQASRYIDNPLQADAMEANSTCPCLSPCMIPPRKP
jgi:hypothetical protein